MVSELFEENFCFGENFKNKELENIIFKNIKRILKYLKKPVIKKGSLEDDMHHGVDYHINWDIPIAFRGRRYAYTTFASKQRGGSFTLRKHGENGGKAEVYKMLNGSYKSRIYVFVWNCGSYAVIDINKWIKSGIIKSKLNISIKNINKKNDFITFTLNELKKKNCIIYFHNGKNTSILDFCKKEECDWFS